MALDDHGEGICLSRCEKMIILIKEHRTGAVEMLHTKDKVDAFCVIERWQQDSIHCLVHGTLPAITWKVAESDDLVGAMIESAQI